MSLYETITSDVKMAMKEKNQVRLDTLRFALSGLNNFQKEKQIKDPDAKITDEEAVAVLQKEVKRRKESIQLFKQGNRADLVEKEEADLAIIAAYIPKELTKEEIGNLVDEAIAANSGGADGGAGRPEFNVVMREMMKLVKGRADGKAVGEVIKSKLGA